MSSFKTAYKISATYSVPAGTVTLIPACDTRSSGGLDISGVYLDDVDIISEWSNVSHALVHEFASPGEYTLDIYTNSGENLTYIRPGFFSKLFQGTGVTYVTFPEWKFENITTVGNDFMFYIFRDSTCLGFDLTLNFSSVVEVRNNFFRGAGARPYSHTLIYPSITFGALKYIGGDFMRAVYWYNSNMPQTNSLKFPDYDFHTVESIDYGFFQQSLGLTSCTSITFPEWDFSNLKSIGDNFLYTSTGDSESKCTSQVTIPAWNMSSVTSVGSNFMYHVSYYTPLITTPAPAVTPTKSWYNILGDTAIQNLARLQTIWDVPAAIYAVSRVQNLVRVDLSTKPYHLFATFNISTTGNTQVVASMPASYGTTPRSYGGAVCSATYVNGQEVAAWSDPTLARSINVTTAGVQTLHMFFNDTSSITTITGCLFGAYFAAHSPGATPAADAVAPTLTSLSWNLDFPNATAIQGSDYGAYVSFTRNQVNLNSVECPAVVHVPSTEPDTGVGLTFMCAFDLIINNWTTLAPSTSLRYVKLPKFIFGTRIPNNFLNLAFRDRVDIERIDIDWDTTSVTSIGNNVLSNFNKPTGTNVTTYLNNRGYGTRITGFRLPDSDMSNVLTIGNDFCAYMIDGWGSSSRAAHPYGQNGIIPVPDWNFASLTTVGNGFCQYACECQTIYITPEEPYIHPHFQFPSLTTVGNYFMACWLRSGEASGSTSVTMHDWDFHSLTSVGANFCYCYGPCLCNETTECIFPDFDFGALRTVGTYFFGYAFEPNNTLSRVVLPAWDMHSLTTYTTSSFLFGFLGNSDVGNIVEVVTPQKETPAGGWKSWFNAGGLATAKNTITGCCCSRGSIWNTFPAIGNIYSEYIQYLYYRPATDYCIQARYDGLTVGSTYTLITAYGTANTNSRALPRVTNVYVDTTSVAWPYTSSAITFTATSTTHTLRIYTESGASMNALTGVGCAQLFYNNSYVTVTSLPKWDFSNVTSLDCWGYMTHYNCANLRHVEVPDWDFSNLTNITMASGFAFYAEMFGACPLLTNTGLHWSGILSFPKLKTVGKAFLRGTFINATGLTSLPDVVVDLPVCESIGDYCMQKYADGCTGITSANAPRLITSSKLKTVGQRYMYMIFANCSNLRTCYFPLSDFSGVTSLGSNFLNWIVYHDYNFRSTALPEYDFGSLTTIPTYFCYETFAYLNITDHNNTTFRPDEEVPDYFSPTLIPKWNFSNVTSIGNEFFRAFCYQSTSVHRLNFPCWDFSKVTSIGNNFISHLGVTTVFCSACLPAWDFSNVTTVGTGFLNNFNVTETYGLNTGIYVTPLKYTGQKSYPSKSWVNKAGLVSAFDQETTQFYSQVSLILPTDWPAWADSEGTSGSSTWSYDWGRLGRGFQNLKYGYANPNHNTIGILVYVNEDNTRWDLTSAAATASSTTGNMTYAQRFIDGFSWGTVIDVGGVTGSKWQWKGYHMVHCSFIPSAATALNATNAFARIFAQGYSAYANYTIMKGWFFPDWQDDPFAGSSTNRGRLPYTGNVTAIPDNFAYEAFYGNTIRELYVGKVFNVTNRVTTIGNSFFARFCNQKADFNPGSGAHTLNTLHFPGITSTGWDFAKVTTIGNMFFHSTFHGGALSSLKMPAMNLPLCTTIGANFFDGIYANNDSAVGEGSYPTITFGKLTSVGNYFFSCPMQGSTVTRVNIPYYDFTSLTSITGLGFFYGVTKLLPNVREIVMPLFDFGSVSVVNKSSYFGKFLDDQLVAHHPDLCVITTPGTAYYDKNQFNAARTAVVGEIDTGANNDVPWYTTSQIGAWEKIFTHLVYGQPTPKISLRLYNSEEIPVTYHGVYLESNKDQYVEPASKKVVWEYVDESGTAATSEEKYLTVKTSQTVTLAEYTLTDGTWVKTNAVTRACTVPNKPTLTVNKGMELPSGCPISVLLSNQENFIGDPKLLVYLNGTSWTSKLQDFTAYHSGTYVFQLIDTGDWPYDTVSSCVIDSTVLQITNPVTKIEIDTTGKNCYMNAVAKQGSQCIPYKFKLDAANQFNIPYTKVYGVKPVTYLITEKHEPILRAIYASGTLSAITDEDYATAQQYFSKVEYNGEVVASTNADAKSWLRTSRTFSTGDIVSVFFDTSTFETKTDFTDFFRRMFASRKHLVSLTIPDFDTPAGTVFNGYFRDVTANCTNLSELILGVPTTSLATDLQYFFAGALQGIAGITTFTFPYMDTAACTNFANFLSYTCYNSCDNLKTLVIPPYDMSAGTDFTCLFQYTLYRATSLESLTLPLFDMSAGTSYTNMYSNAFKSMPKLSDIYSPTIDSEATVTWTNTGQNTNFTRTVVVHHDGDWLSLLNTVNATATEGNHVLYDPLLNTVKVNYTLSPTAHYTVTGLPASGSDVTAPLTITLVPDLTYVLPATPFTATNAYVSGTNPYTITPFADGDVNITFADATEIPTVKITYGTDYEHAVYFSNHLYPYYSEVYYNGNKVAGTVEAAREWLEVDLRNYSDGDVVLILLNKEKIAAEKPSDLWCNLLWQIPHVKSVVLPYIDTAGWTNFDRFMDATFSQCSLLTSATIPLYNMSAGTSFTRVLNGTFNNTTSLTTVTAPTTNTSSIKSWTNTGTDTAFVSNVTINHNGNWLNVSRTANVTSSGTITYNPALS